MRMKLNGRSSGLSLIENIIGFAIMVFIIFLFVWLFGKGEEEFNRRESLNKAAAESFGAYTTASNNAEISIIYNEFDGHRVSLNYYPAFKGRLVLRVRSDDVAFGGGVATLKYLKAEVMRLTTSTNGMPLGNGGVTFHFMGGYPIWGPHVSNLKEGVFSCLYFAEGATMTNNTITVAGQPQKDNHY